MLMPSPRSSKGTPLPPPKNPSKPKTSARTLESFKAAHDPSVIVPRKITGALQKMRSEGPEVFSYETQDAEGEPTMAERAGVGGALLAKYRKLFAAYIVLAPRGPGSKRSQKFVWFGSPAAAREARGGDVNPEDFE